MIFLFSGFLAVITAACFAVQLFFRLRALRSGESLSAPMNLADRYRPMLRLLSESDTNLVSGNPVLRRTVRSQRRKLFRRYLTCLTRDYGYLLHGIRVAMVQSGVDRPDLARAVAKNRIRFALAICRIEYRLALYTLGLGTVDVSGLLRAFDTLRAPMPSFTATHFAATP